MGKIKEKLEKLKKGKNNQTILIIILFSILFVILVSFSISAPVHRWADASTYYMQISSISNDFDIVYGPEDIHRALNNKFDDLPAGLILIKTNEGQYYYGKEFSFALFTVPFFLLLNNHGILLLNALMFWSMILMGYLFLIRNGNSPILSFFTSATFFILSTAFIYVFWVHVEIYNMFLITVAIFLLSLYYEDKNKNYLMIATFIFGIAAVAKLPNFFIFLPVLCYELFNRQGKRVILFLLMFLIPLLFFYGLFYIETGSMSFYGGNRLYYVNQFPFLSGFDAVNEIGRPAFSVEEGRISALISTDILAKSPYNFFYYFFGKFTGMVWYYPLTIFALLSFVIGILYRWNRNNENIYFLSTLKKSPFQYLILFGIALNILFFIAIIGNNYLGGQHAVGNRYFYIFPAFLFLISKINLKLILPFIIIAIFTVIPIITDPIGTSSLPETHTYNYPYPLFPIEYSQINNLPIWLHKYTFFNFTIYDNSKSDHFSIYKNVLSVNKKSQWLVKIDSTNQYFNLIFFTDQKEDIRVSVGSGSYITDIVINETHAKDVIIPLKNIVYENEEYKLYLITIESSEIVYTIPFNNENGKNLKLYFLAGWYNDENWNNTITRWTSGNSSFMLLSDTTQNRTLSFYALSYRNHKNLSIIRDNQILINREIPTNFVHIKVPIFIQRGINVYRLYVPEGCIRPDSSNFGSRDTRCLSIAIQNFTLE